VDRIPGPEPDIRLADDDCVVVSVRVPVSADEAWRAVTERERVARWLGTLSGDLRAQACVRLDFGDGDFFDIEDVRIDRAHRRLRWTWRFMASAPRDDIEIAVASAGKEAIVTVRDLQPSRGRRASLELGEGWRDFTSRLHRHLATGARTRYDWRSDVDVWIELPKNADAARRTLIPAAADWMPLDDGANLFSADALVLDDGGRPERLSIEDVEPAGPGSVRFTARPEGLSQATSCRISIKPRGEAAVLEISHTGFRELDTTDRRRRDLRECCARAWLAAARRAQEILDVAHTTGETSWPDRQPAPAGSADASGSACPLSLTPEERARASQRHAPSRAVGGCPLRAAPPRGP
jgi:uncharacterized protein YndB with AHSA1/START domain